jgi:Fe-S oxidoreductase
VMQPHCHERATFTGPSQTAWLRARGIHVTEAVGCCGMGGNFGYESRHYKLSVAVAKRSLLPAIDAAGVGAALLADGFGCRCQISDLRPAAAPQHLVQLLANLL